jgi:undecaprenyl-diphosphatase
MTLWQAALLGLIQGLTEFLPVSSSGHLVLGQHLLGIEAALAEDVTFEVFVHFGTVLSILTIYWKSIGEIGGSVFASLRDLPSMGARYREDESFRTGSLILLTLIPTLAGYLLFGRWLEAAFSNPRLAAAMLLVTATLLLLTMLRRNPDGPITARKALLVGAAQAFAMIPGISRSGATICAALYQNVSPEKAANFSFLMLLPVVLGATLVKGIGLVTSGLTVDWLPILVGTVVAYASGILAIKLVLDVVRRGRLQVFAYYLVGAGVAGLIFL